MSDQYQSDAPKAFFSPLDFGAKTSDKPAVIISTFISTSNSRAASPQLPTASHSSASAPSSSISAYMQTDKGIHYKDEREKAKNGNGITATKEPCVECSGKIVWVTKGQWLMVCQLCGEPQ
jgi:hypothetical protein